MRGRSRLGESARAAGRREETIKTPCKVRSLFAIRTLLRPEEDDQEALRRWITNDPLLIRVSINYLRIGRGWVRPKRKRARFFAAYKRKRRGVIIGRVCRAAAVSKSCTARFVRLSLFPLRYPFLSARNTDVARLAVCASANLGERETLSWKRGATRL